MVLPKYRKPTHPGEILLEEFLRPLGISQAQFARHLDWTYAKLNEIIREKRGITPDTALDLSMALGTTPMFWLNLQLHYDLWEASQHKREIEPLRIAS
ncbi:MAG: HigA family addiction module antidote protein [Verrucomicrobia bacterium]|nr:HigA family addiction module antidote protein [Verrucomicrobiota bacterium]